MDTVNAKVQGTLDRLEPLLQRTEADPQPVVLMTCGVSGAGKTTHSTALLARSPSFVRLSMDGIIAEKHGIYGRDYSPSMLEEYQDEADVIFRQQLEAALKEGARDIILDRAFYATEDRDDFKGVIERLGGRWVLVYFQVPREELWRRVVERRAKEVDADSARIIDRELLDSFVDGSEVPRGEGEVVVESQCVKCD